MIYSLKGLSSDCISTCMNYKVCINLMSYLIGFISSWFLIIQHLNFSYIYNLSVSSRLTSCIETIFCFNSLNTVDVPLNNINKQTHFNLLFLFIEFLCKRQIYSSCSYSDMHLSPAVWLTVITGLSEFLHLQTGNEWHSMSHLVMNAELYEEFWCIGNYWGIC